jgi:putative oxidoreductase
MFLRLLRTNNDPTLALMRVVLGVVFFAHGAQKMLGWFGGFGFFGTMAMFTQRLGIPAVFAFLAIAAEFFGGLGLIVGLLSRIAALGIACNMAVAIALVHARNGFFMNWYGTQRGEGFEFHLLVLALAVTVIVRGGGFFSIDRVLYWAFEPVVDEGSQAAESGGESKTRTAA